MRIDVGKALIFLVLFKEYGDVEKENRRIKEIGIPLTTWGFAIGASWQEIT